MANDDRFPHALRPGTLVGSYEIVRTIGGGGFGLVYEGLNRKIGMRAAIKEFFPKTFARRDPDGVSVVPMPNGREEYQWAEMKFVEEAQAIAKLNPGGQRQSIVKVIDYLQLNGTAYILMAYEEGQSLEERAPHPLGEDEIIKLLRPLLDGLDWVHKNDVLHRDIKPGNIIIRPDGTPVLVDFGAVKTNFSQTAVTRLGQMTRDYAAPEQQDQDFAELGPWTDLYALGGTVYYMMTGRPPGISPSYSIKGYSSKLLATVKRCLQTDPKKRPQSVAEFRGLLSLDLPEQADGKSRNSSALTAGVTVVTLALAATAYVLYKPATLPEPEPIPTPTAAPATKATPTLPAAVTTVPTSPPEAATTPPSPTAIPTPVATSVPVKLLPRVREILQDWGKDRNCHFLRATPADGDRAALLGHVSRPADKESLANALHALPAGAQVSLDNVMVLPTPLCEVAAAAGALVNDPDTLSGQLAVKLSHAPHPETGKVTYKEGERLYFDVLPDPGFDGYLSVVFVDHQGNVYPLQAQRGSTENRIRNGQPMRFGAEVESDTEHETYDIQPPHGDSLVLVVQSDQRLWPTARDSEDTKQFAAALRELVAKVPTGRRLVSVAPLKTTP